LNRVLLDTSVLISTIAPENVEAAISVASLAELHFRAIDLAIAATANVHGVPLLTADNADFEIIGDLVEV